MKWKIPNIDFGRNNNYKRWKGHITGNLQHQYNSLGCHPLSWGHPSGSSSDEHDMGSWLGSGGSWLPGGGGGYRYMRRDVPEASCLEMAQCLAQGWQVNRPSARPEDENTLWVFPLNHIAKYILNLSSVERYVGNCTVAELGTERDWIW